MHFCVTTNQEVMCRFVEGEEERMMSSKRLQALGWKLRAVEECLRDSVESYKAAGLLPE